ncbi:hypothetical protein OG756_21390 [Streptomyces sp. NBC_01310]|nr:hypothetical protein OG756_21390 [Streptomyces sp. NBC_01310]
MRADLPERMRAATSDRVRADLPERMRAATPERIPGATPEVTYIRRRVG